MRVFLRFVLGTALVGLVLGGALAAYELTTRTHVREFQSGDASPTMERVLAIVQRTAIEGFGFALIALVVGLVALGARYCIADPRTPGATESTLPSRTVAAILVTAAAFAGCAWSTWFTDAALPFLSSGGLLLLHGGAVVALTLALLLAVAIAARTPLALRDAPAAQTLASLVALGIGAFGAYTLLRSVEDGHKDPVRWAMAATVGLAALLLAGSLGRLVKPAVGAVAARLERGPLLPRMVNVGGLVLLGVLGGLSLVTLELSAVPANLTYSARVAPGEPEGPNVILVTIDTLRADHLSCYGYGRPTSPFLDQLAAEGTRFAHPSSAAAWTKPATGTILTGLYPSRHGALHHGSVLQLPEGERTLATAFGDAGYLTAAFVTNPNIKRIFDFDRGFQDYFDSPVEDTVTLAAIRDSYFGAIAKRLTRYQFNWKYANDVMALNRHALEWLDRNHDQPFFLYLHYIDPHIPYTPPAEYEEMFDEDHGLVFFEERKRAVAVDRYDGEIRYTDDGIKQLVERLEQLGVLDNTILAFTSDHGEEFYEHDVLGHGFSLYEPVIRVPLILRGPGILPKNVVEAPVQILDLPATLLDAAGTGVTELGDGRSFADALREPGWDGELPLFLENEFGEEAHEDRAFVLSGVRKGRWKLVLTDRNKYRPPSHPDFDDKELYDLETDPFETRNLFHDEEQRTRVDELLRQLREHAVFLDENGFRDQAPAALSPEMAAELEALGYLGDE